PAVDGKLSDESRSEAVWRVPGFRESGDGDAGAGAGSAGGGRAQRPGRLRRRPLAAVLPETAAAFRVRQRARGAARERSGAGQRQDGGAAAGQRRLRWTHRADTTAPLSISRANVWI